MSFMKAWFADMHAIADELVAEGHRFGPELKARLHQAEGIVESEVKADAEQVAHDAAPVVAEAEHDAVKVAADAVKIAAATVVAGA